MSAQGLRSRAYWAVKRRWNAYPPGNDGTAPTPRAWRQIRHYGRKHQCPICGSKVTGFGATGHPQRPDAICPVCGSLEWHRLGWWFLHQRQGHRLRAGVRVLHVAAEAEIRNQLTAVDGLTYIALDLDPMRASVLGDLCKLPVADNSVDLVYCSHVLEHVDDDLRAMAELRRIVKGDGAALIQVPVTADTTWGDPSIVDPAERTRLFGQHDHVRRYGPDVVDRLVSQGWSVERVRVDGLPRDLVARCGLPQHPIAEPAFDVFWCTPA